MTLAAKFSLATLEKIQQRFRLREVGDSQPALTNSVSSEPTGSLRLFTGPLIPRLIYIWITAPRLNLDSHMICAFTAPESAVPHFMLDAVRSGAQYAFHLDLIPRVDPGANLAYLNAVYQPLTAEYERMKKVAGLSPAPLSPRQVALMSPWMLIYRATESAFAQIEEPVQVYLDHWFNLVELGVPVAIAFGGDAETLAARDRLNRAAIFNPEVDPVWAQVEWLLGPETSASLREMATSQAPA
jgi:hypothetical protein